jgi:hypothetical protein
LPDLNKSRRRIACSFWLDADRSPDIASIRCRCHRADGDSGSGVPSLANDLLYTSLFEWL